MCICDKGYQRIQPCKENLIKTLYSHKGQSGPSLPPSRSHLTIVSTSAEGLLDSRVYPLASTEKRYREKDTAIKAMTEAGTHRERRNFSSECCLFPLK